MKKEARDILQKHFSNHETDVNPDMIWKAIQAKRQQKRRKPFWLFGISGLLLMLIIFGISSYSFSNISKKSSRTSELTSSLKQNYKSTQFPKKQNDNPSLQKSRNNQDDVNPSEIPAETKSTTKTENKKRSILNHVVFKNESVPAERIKNLSQSNTDSKSNFKIADSTIKRNNNLYEKEAVFSTTENSHSFLESVNKSSFKTGKNQINIKRLATLNGLLDLTSKVEYDHLFPQLAPITFRKNINKWSFTFLTGVSHSSSSYTQTIEENISLVKSLETHIKPHINTQFSALISFQISNRFRIATGLSYQKLSEEFSWNKSYIEDFDGNFIRLLEDPEADPFNSLIGSNSSAYSFVKIDRNIFDYNKFQLIDLPLRLYYQLSNSTLAVSCFAGMNYNLWQSINGYTLGNENQLLPYEESDFSLSIGNQYVIGSEISYSVHPKLKLVTEISGQTRQIVEQRYSKRDLSYQISMGLRMNLH